MCIKRLPKKQNAGFTLVELIIVIAIIAILTAVAAPQYIKNVEKSKISKDMNTAAVIESAVSVLCAEGSIPNADDDYVTWDVATGLVGDGKDAVEEITGPIPVAVSKKAKAAGVVVYSVNFNADSPFVTTNVDYSTWDD